MNTKFKKIIAREFLIIIGLIGIVGLSFVYLLAQTKYYSLKKEKLQEKIVNNENKKRRASEFLKRS